MLELPIADREVETGRPLNVLLSEMPAAMTDKSSEPCRFTCDGSLALPGNKWAKPQRYTYEYKTANRIIRVLVFAFHFHIRLRLCMLRRTRYALDMDDPYRQLLLGNNERHQL